MPQPRAATITLPQATAISGLTAKALTGAIDRKALIGRKVGRNYLIDLLSFSAFTGIAETKIQELLAGTPR